MTEWNNFFKEPSDFEPIHEMKDSKVNVLSPKQVYDRLQEVEAKHKKLEEELRKERVKHFEQEQILHDIVQDGDARKEKLIKEMENESKATIENIKVQYHTYYNNLLIQQEEKIKSLTKELSEVNDGVISKLEKKVRLLMKSNEELENELKDYKEQILKNEPLNAKVWYSTLRDLFDVTCFRWRAKSKD